MSEINDIGEIPEVNFPINLKLIQRYQQEEPRKNLNIKMVRTIRVIFLELVIVILTL